MRLWICGQRRGRWSPKGSVWDFQGVFSSKAKAVAACRSDRYFIYPTVLDQEQPDERVLPKNASYPRLEKEKKAKPFMHNDNGCAIFLPCCDKKKRQKT